MKFRRVYPKLIVISAFVLMIGFLVGSRRASGEATSLLILSPETTPFSGSYSDDPAPQACGPRHSFNVSAGNTRIIVVATADIPTNDIVLNLYGPTGNRLSSHDTLTSPETARYEPPGGVPAGTYQVEVCPFNGPAAPPTAPYTYTGTFTTDDSGIAAPSPSPTTTGTPTPLPPAPKDAGPRIGYENFTAPGVLVPVNTTEAGQQIRSVEYMGRNAGEPSIGSNWATGVAMFKSGLESLFITFDDTCPTSGQSASWVNRQAPTSLLIDSDPIGFTDRGFTDALGFHSRTFVGELTLLSPDTVKLSYTDDDGLTWVPDQTGGLASAVDHETIGGGIYHSPIPARPPGTVYPYAVYYCSQDIAFASCSRSDDGGLTYGASVPMYSLLTCGGLHGHVKVSPADGTVYVPNPSCGGKQAVVVSEDNGTTWAIRPTPINSPGGSGGVGSDPAVGVDSNGRVYILGAADGTVAAVATSDDFGGTWQNVFDVSAVYGLQNIAFPAAVAGSTDRAAVAFYGSTTGIGDSNADDFTGVWHLYVAHTFDGGKHWTTTDVTPNAPMQRSGLLRGGGADITRNLLDFFDITIDREGRVLVGYVNGCEGGNCAQAPINPDGTSAVTGNAYTTTATIARQSSGRRLLAANDPPDVLTRTEAPGMPSVTQRRVGQVVHLAWSEADTGNSPITGYQIWRGTASGAETLLTTVPGTQTGGTYDDLTATDITKTYYYKVLAVNAVGTSCGNNEIDAPYVGDYCNGIILHRNDPTHPEANLGTNTPPSLLIDYIAVGEPPSSPDNFMFKMKVNDLSTVPPNSRWRIVWNSLSSPGQQYYVGMTTGPTGPPTFQYGYLADAGVPAVFVISEQTAEPALPESNYQPDGTITIYAPKSAFGNPQPGDLLGAVNGRTFTGDTPATSTLERSNLFIDHTFAKAQTDNSYPAATYTVNGNNPCLSPPTCLEDDDSQIAYSNGWHLINSSGSAGHFRYHSGKSPNHFARLEFDVPAGSTGSITYWYAKSPKGGSADVYIDGMLKTTINYAGPNGSTQAPEFGYSHPFPDLSPGPHTLEIKNMSGVVYVDRFCLTSSMITSNPGTAPGTTSNQSGSASAGQTTSTNYQPQSGSQEMSVVVESSLTVPFKLALVNPSGLTLQTVDAVNGIAVIDAPVTQSGVYVIKVINVSLGPLQFTVTATPLVNR